MSLFAHFSRKNAVWDTGVPRNVLFKAYDLPQWFHEFASRSCFMQFFRLQALLFLFPPPLVVTSLSSFIFFSLSFSVFSLSLSLSLCLCLRVMLRWCCVWCASLCVLGEGRRDRVFVQNALRVSIQNVPVYTGNTRTCVSTCARVAGTHGGTTHATASRPRTQPHTTQTTHTHTTRHIEAKRKEAERRRRKKEEGRERRR